MSTYQFMKIHQHHFHLQPYLDPAVVGMSMILDKYLPFDFSGIKLFKACFSNSFCEMSVCINNQM
jgi:hypothetical protein